MAYLLLLFTMYILVKEYLCENIYRIFHENSNSLFYFISNKTRQTKGRRCIMLGVKKRNFLSICANLWVM